MALDKITTAIIADDAVTAAKIVAGAVGTSEIADGTVVAADIGADAVGLSELSATGTASSTTFLRGDNSWAAGTPSIVDNGNATAMTIDVSENVTNTGNIIMPTNKKVQQKAAFMQSSTHQALTLGY